MHQHINIPMSSSSNPSYYPLDLTGYVFQPTTRDIFTQFLPERLFFGPEALPDHKHVVTEIDLYGKKSPDEIFGSSNATEFYFFTSLMKQKESSKRVRREIAGKGTWQCKSTTQDYTVEIEEGKFIEAGTKRSFKFEFSEDDNNRDESFSWIMHEYVLEKDYINSLRSLEKFNRSSNHNIEDLAFCYVYKKMETKKTINKRKATYELTEESNKKNFNRDDVLTVDLPPPTHETGYDLERQMDIPTNEMENNDFDILDLINFDNVESIINAIRDYDISHAAD